MSMTDSFWKTRWLVQTTFSTLIVAGSTAVVSPPSLLSSFACAAIASLSCAIDSWMQIKLRCNHPTWHRHCFEWISTVSRSSVLIATTGICLLYEEKMSERMQHAFLILNVIQYASTLWIFRDKIELQISPIKR